MPLVSMGDLAQSFQLRSQQSYLKSELSTTTQQLASGQTNDLGKSTRADLTPIAGIEHSLTRLESYSTATAEAALFGQTVQDALGLIQDLGQTLSSSLIVSGFSAGAASVQSATTDARQKFETMVSAINTQVGGRSILSGTAVDRPALAEPDVIIAALVAATATAGGAVDVKNAVDAWFAPGGGFETIGYLGSTTQLGTYQIAQHRNAALGINAMDDRLLGSLKATAMAALVEEGVLESSPTEQVRLMKISGEALLETQASLASLRGEVGAFQSTVEDAVQSNDTERYGLLLARTAIIEIDPYEQATRLETVQTQLESLYAITARLSRLSLVDFLR